MTKYIDHALCEEARAYTRIVGRVADDLELILHGIELSDGPMAQQFKDMVDTLRRSHTTIDETINSLDPMNKKAA